jgi:hypothetical protein
MNSCWLAVLAMLPHTSTPSGHPTPLWCVAVMCHNAQHFLNCVSPSGLGELGSTRNRSKYTAVRHILAGHDKEMRMRVACAWPATRMVKEAHAAEHCMQWERTLMQSPEPA